MTKQQQLYYLLRAFKNGEYDITVFCDELMRILYYESGGINELDRYEQEQLEALANVTKRYSPFKKDRKISKWYSDENEVLEAFKIVYAKLIETQGDDSPELTNT